MVALSHWSRKVGLVGEIKTASSILPWPSMWTTNCLNTFIIQKIVDNLSWQLVAPESLGLMLLILSNLWKVIRNTFIQPVPFPVGMTDDPCCMWTLSLACLVTGIFKETEFLTELKKPLPNNSLQSSQTIDRTNKETNKNWRFGVSSFMWTGVQCVWSIILQSKSHVCVFIPLWRILWGLNFTSARWASTLVQERSTWPSPSLHRTCMYIRIKVDPYRNFYCIFGPIAVWKKRHPALIFYSVHSIFNGRSTGFIWSTEILVVIVCFWSQRAAFFALPAVVDAALIDLAS